ncbi:MAG: hypothetical protein JNL16_06740 [Dechloromonas sp.]|nr:hypothetical protein [Dechloromonas sp.]
MPYEMKWEERGVYSRFFGVVTGEDVLAHAKRIGSDPRVSKLSYQISDFTAIEDHTVKRSDVLFAAATDSVLKSVPLAVIYSQQRPEDLELIELHRNSPLMKSRPMRFFTNEQEARAWLGAMAC